MSNRSTVHCSLKVKSTVITYQLYCHDCSNVQNVLMFYVQLEKHESDETFNVVQLQSWVYILQPETQEQSQKLKLAFRNTNRSTFSDDKHDRLSLQLRPPCWTIVHSARWLEVPTTTATLTGFLGPGLDAGPIIARTDSYQSICIGSLQPHLCRHAVVQSASSNRDCWLWTHAPVFGLQT